MGGKTVRINLRHMIIWQGRNLTTACSGLAAQRYLYRELRERLAADAGRYALNLKSQSLNSEVPIWDLID